MDDQIVKNQYVLEKKIVWLISHLELNLCRFDSSERDDIWKKLSFSRPEKGDCKFTPCKKYLEIETPEKIIIKGSPGFFHPYPCMDKK